MTLNFYKFDFFSQFRVISQISEATTAKRIKIDPLSARKLYHIVAPKCIFSAMYL